MQASLSSLSRRLTQLAVALGLATLIAGCGPSLVRPPPDRQAAPPPARPVDSAVQPGATRPLEQRPPLRLDPSTRVALLLPLSGRAQAAGIAVRDGFLSAYYRQPEGTRPQVSLYDVAASDAPSAYLEAVADGANVVVGPLTREEVAGLAAMADGRVTTLVLNFLPDGAVTPAGFYQFALSPEDEARQAARRAIADGYASGVALVPASEWGQRVLAAFREELAAHGGQLAAERMYAPGTTDFRDIITDLLQLRPVETPEGRPGGAYRADAQFIFVGAQPLAGRMVRTQLRFNYASQLPMYATSDLYEPGGSGNIDLNGVMFPDMPWVLDVAGTAAVLREQANAAWPERLPSRSRLHAFGDDAYAIVAELGRGSAPFRSPLPGLTGVLRLDGQGRIHRDLQFARVEGGQAQLLPSTPGTPLGP